MAHVKSVDANRHDRLASRLTPEIESMFWCLQEAIALGLVELPKRERY
jgi:hypothetical protein